MGCVYYGLAPLQTELLGIDAKKVVAAASSMKEFFTSRKDPLLTEIRTKAALDKDLEAKLQAACEEWKPTFSA